MNKVNFDNLKNLKAPDSWIENAVNIPNTEQKKSPILALFSTKSSRLIAAAACLILVSAVALTVFLTQDRVTPPIDPNFSVTEPTVETEAVTQAQSDSSEQTHSSGDNKSDTTNSSEYEKTEPTEGSTTTTQSGGITSSTQQNSTNAVVKPTAKPVEKETTAKATEPTEKLDDDKDDDEQSHPNSTPSGSTGKPSTNPIVKPTVKPTQAPATEPTEEPVVEPTTIEPTEEPVVKPTSKPNTPPAMLKLPTIPPRDALPTEGIPQAPPEVRPTEPTEPPFTEPSEPFGPPVTATEPTMNVEGSAQDLFIKADGVVYEVQPGAVYQYTFYLTVPSAKVGLFDASTYYDADGLEVIVSTNDYNYYDIEAMYPVFGENIIANLKGIQGELRYNYVSVNGVRFAYENSIAMTIGFKVTASSGVYEINTHIRDLMDTNKHQYIKNSIVNSDGFSTKFVINTATTAPTVKPTQPSEEENEYDIQTIPMNYCPLDKVICVGSSYRYSPSDTLFCSVYDYRVNLIGDGDYYSYRHVAVPTSLENGKTEFVYDPTAYDYITDVGNYFYCFYNQYGTVFYWGNLNVY